jgi:hypothetical protein
MRVLPSLAAALTFMIPGVALAADSAPVPGTITTSVDDPDGATPINAVFDDAVKQALLAAHFMVLPGKDHGRYVAVLSVSHRGLGVVRTPATGQSASVTGAAVSVGLSSHKWDLQELAETKLEVRIFRRGEAQVAWHGAALTTAIDNTVSGQPSVVAQKLANALFRQYPMTSDTPIGVP